MDSALISKKLFSGDFHLRSVSAGKSAIWKKFGIVTDNDKNDLDFVGCTKCYHAFTYKGRASSTAPMARHQCKVSQGQTLLSPITTTAKKTTTSATKKKTMAEACVSMVCKDLRPFETVDGEGFIQVIQTVNINVISGCTVSCSPQNLINTLTMPQPLTSSINTSSNVILPCQTNLKQQAFF
jgi:hypothetical protein